MTGLAVIGGTAIASMPEWQTVQRHRMETPFGEPSADVIEKTTPFGKVFFIARHGEHHTIAPHQINYRANIWALHTLGVTHVIAIAAVGGIAPNLNPGRLVCPNQLIDYSYGREQTFFDQLFSPQRHIDFTEPYDASLRQCLLSGSEPVIDGGVYGVTQGPRLETAAEIQRLARDGCTMVGMTGMPEAALARELDMNYACLALVVNWAAGLSGNVISMAEIEQVLKRGNDNLKHHLESVLEKIMAVK